MAEHSGHQHLPPDGDRQISTKHIDDIDGASQLATNSNSHPVAQLPLLAQRVAMKNRLIEESRGLAELHKYITLPEERERRRQVVCELREHMKDLGVRVQDRSDKWGKWKENVESAAQERHESIVQADVGGGEALVKDLVGGKYLLRETGLPGDNLVIEDQDILRETRFFNGAQRALYDSRELQEDFPVYGEQQSVDDAVAERRMDFLADGLLEEKRSQLMRMNHVRQYAVNLEAEHKRCTHQVEIDEADLGARTERLKKQGPGMTFEARGAARRKLMEDKERLEQLAAHAKAVEKQVHVWREHVQLHGFQPDEVPNMDDIDALTVLESLDEDFLSEEKKAETRAQIQALRAQDELDTKRRKQRKRILPPWEKAKIKEDLPEPPPLNEILDTLPPPKEGTFDRLVMDGRAMGRFDLEERLKARIDRKNAIEKRRAQEMQDDILAASASLNAQENDGDARKTVSFPSIDDARDRQPDLRPKKKLPQVDDEMAVLQAPNTFYQMAMDDTSVVRLGGGITVVEGMHENQVPSLCRDWVLLRCPNSKEICGRRHFYTSKEEKARSAAHRQEVDSRLERRVVECLTQREDLIRAIERAAKESTKKFQDHTDAFVRKSDVCELLDLLAQIRAATVEVVEAIKVWRDAARAMRTKLLHGSGSGAKERAAAAHGFSVKILVEGELLYRGAPPYESQTKRFSRARTLDKKADKWVLVGHFTNEFDAVTAYDRARSEQAVKHNTTVDRMYERVLFLRACGHYAVESKVKHIGKSQSACELCSVKKLEGGVEFNVPFLWNGMNYILKMPHDLDFLNDCEALREYLGEKFPLVRNPFLMINDLNNFEKPFDLTALSKDDTEGRNAAAFGEPGTKVVKYNNGTTEWFGHLAVGTTLTVGANKSLMPQLPFNQQKLDDFIHVNKGKDVQILDMERIQKCAKVILQEEEIAEMMGSIEEDMAKKRKLKADAANKNKAEDVLGVVSKSGNNNDCTFAETSPVPNNVSVAAPVSVLPTAVPVQSRSRSSLSNVVTNTTKSRELAPKDGGPSTVSISVLSLPQTGTSVDVSSSPDSKYPTAPSAANNGFFVPPPGFYENLTAQIQLDFVPKDDSDTSEAESIDEVQAEEEREQAALLGRKQSKWDDAHAGAMTKVAYYSEGGVSLKVPQQRLPKQSRRPGIWVNPDEGEFKVCFDGLNFNKEGMTVRGKRLQHHYYELKLKRDGEDRIKLRTKVQRLLNKSVRNPDLIDTKRVIALVKFAREVKGSLLLLDADKAEAAVARYRGRTLAATTCQRVYRGHVARSISMMTRHVRKITVKMRVARELACALTARRVVPNVMKAGVIKARRQILKPVYSRTHQMDDEDVVLQVFRSNHYDYKYRRVERTCYSCLKWRPRARWDLSTQQMVVQHGPCTCKTVRPVERMLIRGYSPLRSLVYSLSVSEKEMRRRLLLDGKRRGLDQHTLVVRACKYETLPSDYCLRKNVGIYTRQAFEPLREAEEARRNAADAERFAVACEKQALKDAQTLQATRKKCLQVKRFAAYMQKLYLQAHRILFRTQMQLQAMVYASDNAMHFVQAQLDVFADMSRAGENQSFDPLENANDHIWIKRKYEAKKTLILRTLEREEARRHYFKAKYLADLEEGNLKDFTMVAEKSKAKALVARQQADLIVESSRCARPMMEIVTQRILGMLTLRCLASTAGRRTLVFFEPEWRINIMPLRPIPIVFGGWHMRFRKTKFLMSQPFLSFKPHRKLVIISLFEDPLSSQRHLPPFVGGIALSIYEPTSGKHMLLSFNRPDLIDALGHENNDLFEPIEEDADTQYFCPTEACGHRLRARRRLTGLKTSEERNRPPPYSGIGIGVDGTGGPVLRCPRCSTIFHAASSIDYGFMRTGKPHAGYVQRRDVFENRRRAVVERLVAQLCLNRYDKDDVILDKFLLRKQRRVLFERLERCYWWKDLQRGRSSGKGIEIFSEGRKVGGGYVFLTIHENNGDLVFEAYHPRSGLGVSLRVLCDDVTAALAEDPKWANYWESSVSTNVYSPDMLRAIVDKLTFITVPKHPPPPWEGVGTLQWDSTGILEELRKGHARGLREDDGAGVKIMVLRKRQRETYVIKYQETRMVSGENMTTTVLENSRGDMILEAHDPRTAQRHTVTCSRDRLRVVLRDEPKLLSDRGIPMWQYMLNLLALRPDPDAGRKKMMTLRLAILEKQAENAALKCIHTFGRLNALKAEAKYAREEHRRLCDQALAAEDLAEADGGKNKPMNLLRLLARNLNDANAARGLALATLQHLEAAIKDCAQQFYDETLERKMHLRVCTAWRREVAEQHFKSGRRVILSKIRQKHEHWKRIWYGRRKFGGKRLDNGRLVNAIHMIVEVSVKQFGTLTDSRNIWVRMRPETQFEGDIRRALEEREIMAREESHRRQADRVTLEMLNSIQHSMTVIKKRTENKQAQKRAIWLQSNRENAGVSRVQRLTLLARKVGMNITLRFEDHDDEVTGTEDSTKGLFHTELSRLDVAFPPAVKRAETVNNVQVVGATWEPVKANKVPENGEHYTMYPGVFEALRYIPKGDTMFGLEIRKVKELMETSGILDTMYPSTVFHLGYRFPPRDTMARAKGKATSRISDETKACVFIPKGIHYWTEQSGTDPRTAPPEVILAFGVDGKGKWRAGKRTFSRKFRTFGRKPYSDKHPMSINEQYDHEDDTIELGKVWFRTTRKIQGKLAIVTVQGVPQIGRRKGSAIDISSVLRIEIYDPSQSKTHCAVIDADDLGGSRWKQHQGMNDAAMALLDKLVFRNGSCAGALELALSPSAGTTALPVIARKFRFCKRAALLPYCIGSGNEAYSSLSWLERHDFAEEQKCRNSLEERPRPLIRTSRVCRIPDGKPLRLLVSIWRGGGGGRIEAYHPETSRKWTIEIHDDELKQAARPPLLDVVNENTNDEIMDPLKMGVFALRDALEERDMPVYGNKKSLQNRLAAQLEIEQAEKKNLDDAARFRHWMSRRMLRGMSSFMGIPLRFVSDETVEQMWDSHVHDNNAVGAVAGMLAHVIVDVVSYDLRNAPLRSDTLECVNDVFENLIIAVKLKPRGLMDQNARIKVRAVAQLDIGDDAGTLHELPGLGGRGSPTDYTVCNSMDTRSVGTPHISMDAISAPGRVSKTDDEIEHADADVATKDTFEHLFVVEFMELDAKRKHIDMEKVHRVAVDSATNDITEFSWSLEEVQLERKSQLSAVRISSLDLFERDESTTSGGSTFVSPGGIAERFTGVFIPLNSNHRVRRIPLTLATWQNIILSLLGEGNAASERRIERVALEHSGAVMFYRYGVTRNSRASILAKQDIVGDVLWMKSGTTAASCAEVILKADQSAAKKLAELSPEEWLAHGGVLDHLSEDSHHGESSKQVGKELEIVGKGRMADVFEDTSAAADPDLQAFDVAVENKEPIRLQALPTWRKNLSERRALRKNCQPAELEELYQEVIRLEPFRMSVDASMEENVRAEHARRTYRTSAFDRAVEVYKLPVTATKIHEYELESLLAASKEGRDRFAPLGHRAMFEREESLSWLLSHLTLKRSEKSRVGKKLILDRTVCKVVRRLPPHGRLVVLHAIRGRSKSPSQGLGRLFILGFEPATKQQMIIVPDNDVLEGACLDAPHILKGRDRHRNLRRIAERVISELVIMDQNGVPTLSHHKMRWVQDALERDDQLRQIKDVAKKLREKDMALRFALQVACRRQRLERYRSIIQKRRHAAKQATLRPIIHEWGGMAMEDRQSTRLRGFLSANADQLTEIRAAFDLFDADKSNQIDAHEFQQLAFEIGELMDSTQVANALQKIDLDGSGEIDFGEFAMWWLTADHGDLAVSGLNMSFLQAKMRVRQGIREARKKVQMSSEVAKLTGQMHAQHQAERVENERKRREAERMRRQRAAQNKLGKRSFAAQANARVAGKFDAKAGGGDRIKHKVRWDDGIPGGVVGKVLAAPYFYPKYRITLLLATRAEKRQKALARAEVQRHRDEAAKEAAAERLRQKILEEDAREKAEAEAEAKALQEAQAVALAKARDLREAIEKKQQDKERQEAIERKRIADEQEMERKARADEERAKAAEVERMRILQEENAEEFAKQQADKEAEAKRLKDIEDERLRLEKQAKQEAAAKRMEESMAKRKAEEQANSAEAKAEKKRKDDEEREKRTKRLQRRAQGSGAMDAAAKAKEREAKRAERAKARAGARGNVRGKGKKGEKSGKGKKK